MSREESMEPRTHRCENWMSAPTQSVTGNGERRVVFVCTQPVWNVPPFLNVPAEFAAAGSRVWVIGYQAKGLPNFERAGRRHCIIRLPLRARSCSIPLLRKMFSLVEYLTATKRLVCRLDPHTFVAFNDPATLLLRMLRRHPSRKIAWLLEYPEFERRGIVASVLYRFNSRAWEDAMWFTTRPGSKHRPTTCRFPQPHNELWPP
jgi:hypothetical protein